MYSYCSRIIRLFLFMLLVITFTDNASGLEWRTYYGQPGFSESCGAVEQTSDGGYVIAGSRYESGVTDNADIYLVRTDSNGAEEWNRVYGTEGWIDNGFEVHQTDDGGYVIAGTSYLSGTTSNPHISLIKTDDLGNEIWSQTFDDAEFPSGFGGHGAAVQQTPDGGFVIAGADFSSGVTNSPGISLIKTDSSGDLDWRKSLGEGYYGAQGFAVQQAKDGGYMISGSVFVSGVSSDRDIYLIKADASGTQEWAGLYGESEYDEYGYAVQQTLDSGYVIGGTSHSVEDPQKAQAVLLKIDASGSFDWSRTYGEEDFADHGFMLQQTADGGFVIVGTTFQPGVSDDIDTHLIKTDADGVLEWRRFFPGHDDDYGISVQQTGDGGYAIAGTTYASGTARDADIFMLYSEPLERGICPDPTDTDSDDDGIPDEVEDANGNGIVDTVETSPCDPDTDGDGIQDGTEFGLTLVDIGPDTDPQVFIPDADPITTTNPLNPDTDNDGISDGDEDLDHDGMVDPGEGDPLINEAFGSISGTVYASDGVTPLPNIVVTAYEGDCGVWSFVLKTATTDENGVYTIQYVSAGDVFVRTNSSGYHLGEYYTASGDYTTDCSMAQPVAVVAGQNTSGIDFSLSRGGIISGTVHGSDGVTPLEGIRVQAYTPDCGELIDTALSYDVDGVYSITVPPGNVVIRMYALGQPDTYAYEYYTKSGDGTPYCNEADEIMVAAPGVDVTGINFTLKGGGTVSGTVFENDGITPIQSLLVYVYEDKCTERVIAGSRTNEFGEFTIYKIPSGEFYVYATGDILGGEGVFNGEWYDGAAGCEDAQPIQVIAGSDTDGVVFQLDAAYLEPDQDGDGLPDSLEESTCTDPFDTDSDGDGIPDGVEDADKSGDVNAGETNPCNKDSDGDGFWDGSEDKNHNGRVDAGETDPNDISSHAAGFANLYPGFNQISIHAAGDLKDLLPTIGDSSEITQVLALDTETGTFVLFNPGATSNPSFILSGNEGVIVYTMKEKQMVFDTITCTQPVFKEGTNLIGISCPAEGYSAYQFLSEYGAEGVDTVFRYSPVKGVFETASIGLEGTPVGVDFAIVSGEGYGVIKNE